MKIKIRKQKDVFNTFRSDEMFVRVNFVVVSFAHNFSDSAKSRPACVKR